MKKEIRKEKIVEVYSFTYHDIQDALISYFKIDVKTNVERTDFYIQKDEDHDQTKAVLKVEKTIGG